MSKVEVLGDPNYPPREAVEKFPTGMALVIDARGELGGRPLGFLNGAVTLFLR